jgi:acyl dehydratase
MSANDGIVWPPMAEQLPKRKCGPVDAEALKRYALASGDDNPLHLNLAIAKRAGLEERPIHGMLMAGHFEPMIHAWRKDFDLIGLSIKFLRPVLVGQLFELSGRVIRVSPNESPNIVLRLMAHGLKNDGAAGELALVAEAKLRALNV